jgi:CheY-like chemotaxis protein
MKPPAFGRPGVYRCEFCGASNVASDNRWCACGTGHSLICAGCGQCFCAASEEWRGDFWSHAPEPVRSGHLLQAPEGKGAADPYARFARPFILVVDDDSVVHSIFSRALASFPGTVLHARDGHQALAIARKARPDLLLTDALLPGMDGRLVAKTLKMEPATSSMGVAVMTGLYKGTRYRNEALQHFSADVYLEKPVTTAKLWDVIEQTLQISRPVAPAILTDETRVDPILVSCS